MKKLLFLLVLIVLVCCQTQIQKESIIPEKSIILNQEQFMVIWQTNYMNGVKSGLTWYINKDDVVSRNQWKLDSLNMVHFFEECVKID